MDDAVTSAQTVRLLRSTQLIAALITLYDHACTLDAEVKYIWNKSWNSSKILFIAVIIDLSSYRASEMNFRISDSLQMNQ
ncbi:hypothetical protein BDQ17DRAFT_1439094 [Cyathus striatus]|nr:hypothetical protein BDQ17DRAFT_1439094 [Cyathus striatus]